MNEELYQSKRPEDRWGTGVVIVDSGKVLLGLRTDNSLWGSPGGAVEVGETPLDAVIRETNEETGLVLNPLMTKFVSRIYSYNEGFVWDSFTFITNYITGELIPQPGEFSELKWVPINELQNYNLFTPTKESIIEILRLCPQYLYESISTLDVYATTTVDQMAELVTTFEGFMGVEYTVSKIQEFFKMTATEQLVDVKNPGRNNGTGTIGADGNWKYTKPGSGEKTTAPAQNKPDNSKLQQNLQKLKQSYIQHFEKNKEFKKYYQVDKNAFSFPDYTSAKQQGIVEDKKSYVLLFKEQYIHFALTNSKTS